MEVSFIAYLEKSKQVKWWFKNGKQDGSYFAVPYIENGAEKSFYVQVLEEAYFEMSNNTLVITNVGNVNYEKEIQISIGSTTCPLAPTVLLTNISITH